MSLRSKLQKKLHRRRAGALAADASIRDKGMISLAKRGHYPFKRYLEIWLLRAHHRRNLEEMHPYLLQVENDLKQGRIDRAEMQARVGKELARRRLKREEEERKRREIPDECQKNVPIDYVTYDEKVWWRDECDKYQSLTRRRGPELVLALTSTRTPDKPMVGFFKITFTNVKSACRFHRAFRRRMAHSCGGDVGQCFVELGTPELTGDERSPRLVLGPSWGAESNQLCEDLDSVSAMDLEYLPRYLKTHAAFDGDETYSQRRHESSACRIQRWWRQRKRLHSMTRGQFAKSTRRRSDRNEAVATPKCIRVSTLSTDKEVKRQVEEDRRKRKLRKRNKKKRLRKEKRRRKKIASAIKIQRAFRAKITLMRGRRIVGGVLRRWRAWELWRCAAVALRRQMNASRTLENVAHVLLYQSRRRRFLRAVTHIQVSYRRRRDRLKRMTRYQTQISSGAINTTRTFDQNGRCFRVLPYDISVAMVIPPERRLTSEIVEFSRTMTRLVTLMAPSYKQTMMEVRRVIQTIFPCAYIKLYGSVDTKTALPSSDLDIVILHRHKNEPCTSRHIVNVGASCLMRTPDPFEQLSLVRMALNHEPWAKGCKLVGNKMPLLKLQVMPPEMISSYKQFGAEHSIDISSGMSAYHSGLRAAKWLNEQCNDRPVLRDVLLVLKQLCRESGVADSYTGGIGSFLIALLLIRLLQHNDSIHEIPFPQRTPNVEPSRVLMQFLRFYGKEFNARHFGIDLRDGGAFFSLQHHATSPGSSTPPYILSPFQKPTGPLINIASGMYRFADVQRCFARAHDMLLNAFKGYWEGCSTSILRSLLRIRWGADSQRQSLLSKMKQRFLARRQTKR